MRRHTHRHHRPPSADDSTEEDESDDESTSSEMMKCVSCKDEYDADDAGTCRECYEEASETEEELKREIEELKSKVNFLKFWGPLDSRPHHYHRSTVPCFTDVVLVAVDLDSGKPVANSVPVPANKALLASRSPVFRAMLETEMEESLSGTIKLSDVSYDALRAFVNFLYTAETSLDDDMACDLLILADKYEVKHLKTYCEKFLISKLNWESSLMNYSFAHRHNAKTLLDAALSLILDNMDKLSKREEYLELVEKDPRLVVDIYEAYLSKQVMARSSPTDKLELVKHLRGLSGVVAVTGDGTNDAPALHELDIGFAMGIAGTEVAKEQADVIVMDDDFATIVKVAKWGRAVYINIQKFVQFQLTVNIVALMINFVSACITGSAPLTAVQLLWVNLIMDTLGALALATEPPNDGLMSRQPVKRTESFITKTMWRNIIGQSVYQMAILFVLNFAGKPILNLHGHNATAVLNTFIFNTFVFCQVFNEINSRDIDNINIFRGMLSSWIFVAVMISIVVFQVIIVEFLGTFASTVPLNWELWLLSIAIGFVSMPIAVVLKCIPVENPIKQQHDGYEIIAEGPDHA